MEAAQIAVGKSYDDKEAAVARRVLAIRSGIVEYAEESEGYWALSCLNTTSISLEEFAQWADHEHPIVGTRNTSLEVAPPHSSPPC